MEEDEHLSDGDESTLREYQDASSSFDYRLNDVSLSTSTSSNTSTMHTCTESSSTSDQGSDVENEDVQDGSDEEEDIERWRSREGANAIASTSQRGSRHAYLGDINEVEGVGSGLCDVLPAGQRVKLSLFPMQVRLDIITH